MLRPTILRWRVMLRSFGRGFKHKERTRQTVNQCMGDEGADTGLGMRENILWLFKRVLQSEKIHQQLE